MGRKVVFHPSIINLELVTYITGVHISSPIAGKFFWHVQRPKVYVFTHANDVFTKKHVK
jgi:hypothetical protein